MFQNFVTKHNSPQFTTTITKAVTPAALAPIINTPTVARDNLFVNLTITALTSPGGISAVVAIDNSSHTDNQVISIAASLSTTGSLVPVLCRFESATVPTAIPASAVTYYPLEFNSSATALSVKDCATVSTISRSGNPVYVGLALIAKSFVADTVYGSISINQVDQEITTLQPLK